MKTAITLAVASAILIASVLAYAYTDAFNLVTSVGRQQTETHDRPNVTVSIPHSRVNYYTLAEKINVKRSESGVKPALMVNSTLNQSAQLKANDMAKNSYWSHNSPTGTTPWYWFNLAGYEYEKAGENLAKCYNNEDDAVDAWFNSPTHRGNILGDYDQVGFGTTYLENCFVIVNHFGKVKS